MILCICWIWPIRRGGNIGIEPARRKCEHGNVSADEILAQIKQRPVADWLQIQSGIGQMLAGAFSEAEVAQVAEALREADDDFSSGRVTSSEELRGRFGRQ